MKCTPRVSPASKQLLQHIAQQPQGTSTLECKQLGIFADPARCVIALDHLCEMGLIRLDNTGRLWSVTADGLSRLAGRITAVKSAHIEDAQPMVVPPRRVEFTGVYMGEELRPQTARPAGNTHTKIPSLMNGIRHFAGLDNRS